MIKKIFVFAILFATSQLQAQENTASPYSFFGVGDEQFKGTTENRSMGGLNVLQDSTHVNLYNPATLAGLKNTVFTLGATYNSTTLTSSINQGKASSGILNYAVLAFPMGKFSMGMGIMPYSSVGFRLEQEVSSTTTKKYGGSGGVNKIFISSGYKITPELSAGLELTHYFGNIGVNIHQQIEGALYTTTEVDRSKIKGGALLLGLHYKKKFKSKLEIQTSMTYSFGSNLTSENSSLIYINKPTVLATPSDTLNPNTPNTTLKLAKKFTMGVAVGHTDKWFAGLSMDFKNRENFGTRLININNVAYGKANKISLGGYYIPNKYSFSKYWKRITYRAGAKFENTGMIVNGIQIVDLGTSFGIGLPMGNARDPFSSFNIGFDLGKRGTTSGNLVKENYFNVYIGFTLNNKWFIKKKYN